MKNLKISHLFIAGALLLSMIAVFLVLWFGALRNSSDGDAQEIAQLQAQVNDLSQRVEALEKEHAQMRSTDDGSTSESTTVAAATNATTTAKKKSKKTTTTTSCNAGCTCDCTCHATSSDGNGTTESSTTTTTNADGTSSNNG